MRHFDAPTPAKGGPFSPFADDEARSAPDMNVPAIRRSLFADRLGVAALGQGRTWPYAIGRNPAGRDYPVGLGGGEAVAVLDDRLLITAWP